jgi:hypothetical protein
MKVCTLSNINVNSCVGLQSGIADRNNIASLVDRKGVMRPSRELDVYAAAQINRDEVR